MINRILIRVKVVQMLYSYLLTRSEFKIDDAPESASRDRRYAYSAYIDFILFLLELSGYSVKNGDSKPLFYPDSKLSANKVAKALAANDSIRAAILRGNSKVGALDSVLSSVHNKIVTSKVFTDYSKKSKHELVDDVTLWTTIFETIIANDPDVEMAMRADEAFTVVGYNSAIKNLCNTLRSYNDSRQLLVQAQNDLQKSLDKAYELYIGLLQLIVQLTDLQVERLENAKNKYIVTSEDLNPNMRLADNMLADYLRNSEELASLLKDYKVQLAAPTSSLLKTLLDKILDSDIYKQYIEKPVSDFASDVDFWREVMKSIILPSDALSEELEDSSVFWNDDVNIMGTFVLKTLKKLSQSEGKKVPFLPKYKDDDDAVFGGDLFMYAVKNYEAYRTYIDKFVDNTHWDPERMAYMDIVIMVTAIAEIINYPAIPIPVSINEYVEIANNYSTEKSGAFINGILFSVINFLKEQGVIVK